MSARPVSGDGPFSRIYEGRVRHRRRQPVAHEFSYRMFMMYLDLDELPTLFQGRWFWSNEGRGLARFDRAAHLGDPGRPLDECVRDLVRERTGDRPVGPIRLLTHLRYFGHRFNPVSFYYCFDERGRDVHFIVAEINNTPWGEQHCYVCDRRTGAEHRFAKDFHVSPFMPMDQSYRWRFGAPGERLDVFMENSESGAPVFDASLSLEARPVSGPALASVLLRFPLMTVKVVAAIYWQALKLWLKDVPVFDHPGTADAVARHAAVDSEMQPLTTHRRTRS
ncbi:MAG: DUF1365 domain-containing protein [Gammaproteobacteria bacterium]